MTTDSLLPPGPWTWSDVGAVDRPLGSGFVYLVDATGKKIGTVWGTPVQKVAIATLTSASPVLLAALHQFCLWAEKANGKGGDTYLNGEDRDEESDGWTDLEAIVRTAKAAIALAEEPG